MGQSKTAKNSLNKTLPKLVSISSPFIVWCPKNDWQLNPAWVWTSLHLGVDSRLSWSYFAFKICNPSFRGNASTRDVNASLGTIIVINQLWYCDGIILYLLLSLNLYEQKLETLKLNVQKNTEWHPWRGLNGALCPVRGRQRPIVEPTGLQLGLYYPSHPVLMDTMSLLASHYCLNYRQY